MLHAAFDSKEIPTVMLNQYILIFACLNLLLVGGLVGADEQGGTIALNIVIYLRLL